MNVNNNSPRSTAGLNQLETERNSGRPKNKSTSVQQNCATTSSYSTKAVGGDCTKAVGCTEAPFVLAAAPCATITHHAAIAAVGGTHQHYYLRDLQMPGSAVDHVVPVNYTVAGHTHHIHAGALHIAGAGRVVVQPHIDYEGDAIHVYHPTTINDGREGVTVVQEGATVASLCPVQQEQQQYQGPAQMQQGPYDSTGYQQQQQQGALPAQGNYPAQSSSKGGFPPKGAPTDGSTGGSDDTSTTPVAEPAAPPEAPADDQPGNMTFNGHSTFGRR